MIRDVATVDPGEPVTVHEGQYAVASGLFRNFNREAILVEQPEQTLRVPIHSDLFFVTDMNGLVLGTP